MSTRRAYGEDSIYKDGDRWRGAISLGYNADGRRGCDSVGWPSRDGGKWLRLATRRVFVTELSGPTL
jgi:hypothetical protein